MWDPLSKLTSLHYVDVSSIQCPQGWCYMNDDDGNRHRGGVYMMSSSPGLLCSNGFRCNWISICLGNQRNRFIFEVRQNRSLNFRCSRIGISSWSRIGIQRMVAGISDIPDVCTRWIRRTKSIVSQIVQDSIHSKETLKTYIWEQVNVVKLTLAVSIFEYHSMATFLVTTSIVQFPTTTTVV